MFDPFQKFGALLGRDASGLGCEVGADVAVHQNNLAVVQCGFKPRLEAALNNGQIVLVDRYIGSNLAPQTARVPPEKRSEFLEWIEHLEYGIYGLPRESLILYLRVPPQEAQRLVERKSARSYTSAPKDLLEASLRHLEDAAEMDDYLSRRPPWGTIQC